MIVSVPASPVTSILAPPTMVKVSLVVSASISVTPTVTVPKALAPAAVFEIVNVLSSVLAIPIPEPGANITSSVKRLEAVNLSTAFVLPSSAADIE